MLQVSFRARRALSLAILLAPTLVPPSQRRVADLYAVGGHLAPRFARVLGRYRSGKASYVEAGQSAFRQRTVLLRNVGSGRFEEWKDSCDLGENVEARRAYTLTREEGLRRKSP